MIQPTKRDASNMFIVLMAAIFVTSLFTQEWVDTTFSGLLIAVKVYQRMAGVE